jgi:hypothetical protein
MAGCLIQVMMSAFAAEGLPIPGRSSEIDAADDFFRIRLACTLLDTCGACFDRGSNKKKLDQFLTVFQASDASYLLFPATFLSHLLYFLGIRAVQSRVADGCRIHGVGYSRGKPPECFFDVRNHFLTGLMFS